MDANSFPVLALLFVYSVGLIALGLFIGRKVTSAASFFVADRGLGPGLLGATVLAANIGAGSTVGAAGRGWQDGLAAWWWVGSAGIGTLLLAMWIGPRMWRLAKEHDYRTVGDFLEDRFGSSVRGSVAVLLWLGTLAILAGQLIAMAWVLHAVAGIPKMWGCILGGLVMTIYFTAGGLLTSAWVNLVQLSVLVIGFLLALPLALDAVGGLDGLRAAAPNDDYWNFFQNGASGWNYLALLVPAFLVSPGLLQKAYGARDERTVRIGIAWSGLALLVFAAFPALLGMIARALHPDLLNPELALPTLLIEDLPKVIGLIALTAVFSAEISSADAILFMLSTSLSQDLYKRYIHPEADDARILKVARLAAVVGGILGVLLAAVLPSVISSLTIFYSLLGVSLFVPILAGLHARDRRTTEALAAIIVGIAVLIGVRQAGVGFGIFNANLLALIASAVAFGCARFLRRSTAA